MPKISTWQLFKAFCSLAFNRYEAANNNNPARSIIYQQLQDARLDITATDRKTLQKKAVFFEQNDAITNKLCDLFEQFTVGSTGKQITPRSESKEWNALATQDFNEWCYVCDLTTRHNWGTVQSLIARLWFIYGEVFIHKTYSPDSGRPRVQLIEAHRIFTPERMVGKEGKTIVDGVQINDFGRPVYYWLDGTTPISADNMIHVFEPSRANQFRGIPFLSPVMNDLHDLKNLQDYEMAAAKDASEISNVFKNKTGQMSVQDLMRLGLSSSSAPSADRVSAVATMAGGRTIALADTEELTQFRSERPSVASREYWDYLTSKICSGVGISKLLVFPWSMQGTVTRADLDVQAGFFKSRSGVLSTFFREIFIWVIDTDGRFNPALSRKPANWTNVSVSFPRSANVDVGRNSTAMINEYKAGMLTLESIYGELGLDWKDEVTKRADEIEFIKQLAQDHNIDPSEISDTALVITPEPTPQKATV